MRLIPSRDLHLRPHDWKTIGLNVFATTIGTVLVVLDFGPDKTVWHWLAGAGIVLASASYMVRSASRSRCTGHAWATGEQTFADLSLATPSQLAETWKLSPEYITLTQHPQGVVSTPIRAWDDPERMVGIVSVDCEVPNSESGLTSQPSLDAALALAAASVARILSLAELV